MLGMKGDIIQQYSSISAKSFEDLIRSILLLQNNPDFIHNWFGAPSIGGLNSISFNKSRRRVGRAKGADNTSVKHT